MLKILRYLYLFPIIIICFFYSVDKYVLQSAVDGGLILGGFVNFPENFSNITSSNHNIYTTLSSLSMSIVSSTSSGFSKRNKGILATLIALNGLPLSSLPGYLF